MSDALTRDDLARLRELTRQYRTRPTFAGWQRLADRLVDLDSDLLAAAERDLGRREGGLVFGPEDAGCRYAVATDGVLYTLTRLDNGAWLLGVEWDGYALTNHFATEPEAIEAARAHDKARRGVR